MLTRREGQSDRKEICDHSEQGGYFEAAARKKVVHCKKNWSENKSLFRIPISPTVFSISAVQSLCTSPLSLFQITQVGKKL